MEAKSQRWRVLAYKQLRERGVLCTRQHLARLEKAGLFRKRIRIGPNRVAWLEDEVDGHVERAAAAHKGA